MSDDLRNVIPQGIVNINIFKMGIIFRSNFP